MLNVVPSNGLISVIELTTFHHAVPLRTMSPVVKLHVKIGSEKIAVKSMPVMDNVGSA